MDRGPSDGQYRLKTSVLWPARVRGTRCDRRCNGDERDRVVGAICIDQNQVEKGEIVV